MRSSLLARFSRHVAVTLIALLVAPAPAQTDLSTLRGVATDPAGAVVPKVSLTLTNKETGIARQFQTNEAGEFEIPYLTPGQYRLAATAAGFKTFVADNILITAREIRRIDLTLELGSVGTEVTVSGGAALIETEGAQIADGFNKQQFVDSPLSQSFFPQAYMTTLPNVQTDMGGWSLRFAGQPPSQVAESMDGILSDGTVNLVQNMNDFEELQVVSVGNSAEFSRVANFGMTGKSGTNQFHGKAYYDFINSALNARQTFSPFKVPYKEHRGGGHFSGPIIKNRTFFYAAYSLVRIPSATFFNRNVPTEAFRRGDFSRLLNQARPVQVRDPLNGQPLAGNILPASRFNPVAVKTQDTYIPRPNIGGPDLISNNYGFLHPYALDLFKWDSTTDRVDHKFSEKNTIFGRFINRITPYILAGSFPDVGTWTRLRNHHSIVISDTHVFSPSLVNTFRWGWAKDYFIDGDEIKGFKPVTGDQVVQTLGIQGVNPRGLKAMGFPTMNITGVNQLRVQPGGVNLDRNDFTFSNSLTWNRGSHVMKYGGELRWFRDFNGGIPEGTYGIFNFDGFLSGEAYADFLLGLPRSSSRLDPFTDRFRSAYEAGLFAQDTYKVSRRVTLDLGLRWEYFSSPLYSDNLQFNWQPDSNTVSVPQEALSKVSPLYPKNIRLAAGQVKPNPPRNLIRPRIGAAWRIKDDFVLRGGYGAYSEALGQFARIQTGGPFQISETYFNDPAAGTQFLSFPNPFPSSLAAAAAAPSQSINGFPLNTKHGIIHQFNASLEKELHGFGLRLSYIGSRSRGLNYLLQLNKPQPSTQAFTAARRPYQPFVGAAFWQNDGRANYDGGQVQLTRKVGAVKFDFHYTLSNSLADYLNLENPYSHTFWNRDQYNSRHRAVFNVDYDIPVGRGRRYLATAPAPVQFVLGGWSTNWVSYFQSGQYFSPTYSGADPSGTNSVGGFADRIGNGNLDSGQRNPNRWFDASAFAPPPLGRFGNTGVNVLEGPGLNLHHLSVVKEFRVTERLRVNYQAMVTDIFNTPHYTFPNSNITVTGQVARIFGLQGGGAPREKSASREVQMRLRIEF